MLCVNYEFFSQKTTKYRIGVVVLMFGSSGPAIEHPAEQGRETMAQAHKLDCESVSDTCRFIIQSENEEEAVELAQKHMKEVHEQEYTEDELRDEHMQVV